MLLIGVPLRLSLILTALFALLLALFHAPDYHPVPALTACDALCWQGLQVQSTRRDQALEVMTRLNGVPPIFAVCYDRGAQSSCELYRWDASDGSVAVVEVEQGRLTLITLYAPSSLTLGDLLLALQRLGHPLEAYLVTPVRDSLNLQLTFAASSLTLELTAACPTTYFSLLHTPVNFIGIDAPVPSDRPAVPFRLVRRSIYEQCERR